MNTTSNWPMAMASVLLSPLVTIQSAHAQTFTTLHSFVETHGANPYGALVQATNGDFYGTTSAGGANGDGTVFKIAPSGGLTTLYSFCPEIGCPDGDAPYAGLIQGTSGDFYGTAQGGGDGGGVDHYGTVFKITPTGGLTLQNNFHGTDGSYPVGGLIQATNGDFYGTAPVGGLYGLGVVFKITPLGVLTTVQSFGGVVLAGGTPNAGLIPASNGDFYGTSEKGGIVVSKILYVRLRHDLQSHARGRADHGTQLR